MNLYQFHPQLVVRTPSWPFTLDFSAAGTRALLADELFMEAIYLASPALHDECRKWQQGELTDDRKVEKLCRTLTRYHARITSRCTPFGLFAGCALAEWGTGSQLRLASDRRNRHTRLDMHYLCALARQLSAHADIRPRLRHWPNTSHYRIGEELRYVEHHFVEGVPVHQISSVAASPYLDQVLAAAQDGRTPPQLLALLPTEAGEEAEAAAFIDALIDAQLLVSELEPTVTGPEFFGHVQAVLKRLAAEASTPAVAASLAVLAEVEQQLRALDHPGANPAAAYEQVMATLAPLGVPPEPGKLFQTDGGPGLAPEQPATLDAALQVPLREALEVLACLTPAPQDTRLADFTRRFQARYEEQEVPLLEALDNESGLAYSDYGKSSYAPFVHDLVLDGAARPRRALRQNDVQHFMYHKLREAERSRHYSLDIGLTELRQRGFWPGSAPLPPSVAVMFRPVGAGQLLLESAGGSSAVNLLGRFAHANAGIGHLVQEITRHEQEQNPDVAFAEICHLPASRVGNLLLRPCFRALEIPYLAQSALPAEGQVPVQDLTLAARGGQLQLRSRRTGQLIVPRLSTAHNFTRDALPVYELLCDLQTQGLQPQLGFSWSSVSLYAKFTPRLSSGRVVLAAAAWQLEAADLQPLLAAPPAAFAGCFAEFRARWQLPRFFLLAEGDNELFIDAENELLVQVWLDAVRGQASVSLKEFLYDPATSTVRDEAGRPYVAQFIALLLRQAPCYAGAAPAASAAPAQPVPRSFALGSEWLYYKLYCGPVVADRVLLDVVRPLVAELRAQGLVDTWFFIRYADPDPHLRVRWHLPDPRRLGEVVQLISRHLQAFGGAHAVWKIQADFYQRELERYGGHGIVWAERLFCYQSNALLDYLAHPAAEEAQPPIESWLWGLVAIEELLTAFDYPLAQRVALFGGLKDAFTQEFNVTKAVKRQLDAKYRPARPAIAQALSTAPAPAAELLGIVRGLNALEAAGALEVPRAQLLGSYAHMLLNRLFPGEARLHELVLYDFLFRHYESCLARQRVPATSSRP